MLEKRMIHISDVALMFGSSYLIWFLAEKKILTPPAMLSTLIIFMFLLAVALRALTFTDDINQARKFLKTTFLMAIGGLVGSAIGAQALSFSSTYLDESDTNLSLLGAGIGAIAIMFPILRPAIFTQSKNERNVEN